MIVYETHSIIRERTWLVHEQDGIPSCSCKMECTACQVLYMEQQRNE